MITALLWGILAVLTFGTASVSAISWFTPWLVTIIVLAIVWVVGKLIDKRSV